MKYQTISLFPVKGTIYYVTIAMVIFSGVTIKEDIMFSRKSSSGISLMFILTVNNTAHVAGTHMGMSCRSMGEGRVT